MNPLEKYKITQLRKQGESYTTIARHLNISVNTIKSFCRRNDITIAKSREQTQNPSQTHCENCQKEVIQTAGRKRKRFCCDTCRNKWWNAHLDLVDRKAIYRFTCRYCGMDFEVYGNDKRKYCSHSCYINHRFGGNVHG